MVIYWIRPIAIALLFALNGIPMMADETMWQAHMDCGRVLFRTGAYARAADEFKSALHCVGSLGSGDLRLPVTLTNLGATYRSLGRYADAERCHREAITLYQDFHPDQPTALATALENLGSVYLTQGEAHRAEPLLRRAYQIRIAAGDSGQTLAPTLHGLAQIAHQQRRFQEAERMYREALAAFGPESLQAADISHNLGTLYADMGRGAEAQVLLEHALALYSREAPGHPSRAVMLRNYAELTAREGNRAKADELFQEAIEFARKNLGAEDFQTGVTLQAYSSFLQTSHRTKDAKRAASRARAILAKSVRESGASYTVDVRELGPK